MLLCDTQLEARASGNIQVLQDLYRALYADWKRMVDEAEQLEQRHAEGLPDATFARIGQLLKASRSTQEAMQRVLEQMRAIS
ncbi:unnamed protein product [Tilletia laevis]|uniref:Uncharacterized protein n=1 Tax=Tilletia laevis TaxID=157183 RepID=A0A9N8LIN1_9BASI|nr:unnamed protein product [Tilletia laevis]